MSADDHRIITEERQRADDGDSDKQMANEEESNPGVGGRERSSNDSERERSSGEDNNIPKREFLSHITHFGCS